MPGRVVVSIAMLDLFFTSVCYAFYGVCYAFYVPKKNY